MLEMRKRKIPLSSIVGTKLDYWKDEIHYKNYCMGMQLCSNSYIFFLIMILFSLKVFYYAPIINLHCSRIYGTIKQ